MSSKSGSCVAWPFFGRAVAVLAGAALFTLSPEATAVEASLAAGGNLTANERETRGGALFRGAFSSRLDTHPDGRGALVTADVLGYADERHPLVVTGALGGYSIGSENVRCPRAFRRPDATPVELLEGCAFVSGRLGDVLQTLASAA